jgi:uroporphyrinogen-III synthase
VNRGPEPGVSLRDCARGFAGLKILSLESRRGPEMTKLIANCGGQPIIAPSVQEVPLQSNPDAFKFAGELFAGRVDVAIFLTGVGARALTRVIETRSPRRQFAAALARLPVVVRGPKAAAAMRELGVPIAVTVPEPNTWRELLDALDRCSESVPIKERTVAVQEYGVSNPDLLDGLAARGAKVMPVPVYEWELPKDLGPLRSAVRAIIAGEVDGILFTTSVQVRHLFQVARQMGLEEELRRACRGMMVASVGPVTSEEVRAHAIGVDLEPSHPKMGFLVQESSNRCEEILQRKRRAT